MTNQECSQIFARLSEYLNGDLPPNLCEEMSEHIRDCEPCVAFVDSLKKSIGLVREVQAKELPGPVKEEVRAQLWSAFEQFRSGKS